MRAHLLAALLLLAPAPPAAAAADVPPPVAPVPTGEDERAVSAAFDAVRTALLRGRGRTAVDLLSHDSVRALEAIREAARTGGEARLQRLPPAERFAALGLRRYLSPSDIRRKSLGELADHALKERWLKPDTVRDAALGPIRVKGDRATALLLVNHRPALIQADFVREGGVWRFDLANVLHVGNQFLRGFAAVGGKSEDAFIQDLLTKLPPKR